VPVLIYWYGLRTSNGKFADALSLPMAHSAMFVRRHWYGQQTCWHIIDFRVGSSANPASGK